MISNEAYEEIRLREDARYRIRKGAGRPGDRERVAGDTPERTRQDRETLRRWANENEMDTEMGGLPQ